MARRATSLVPKPSLFVFFGFVFCFVCFPFLSLLLIENPVFHHKKGFVVYFWVSPFVLLSRFGPPPFSVSLSLSLSLSSLSSFLLVFLVCFLLVPCFSLFISFFLFVSSLLLFYEKNIIKMFNYKVFFHQSFLFFWFPLFCFLSDPLSLSLFFSWF